MIFIQIMMGAFVSGLDAGQIYQTWPLMGNNFFPNDLIFKNFNDFLELDNHSLVQFYHRMFAYVLILYSFFLVIFIYINKHLYQLLKLYQQRMTNAFC